MDRCRCKCHFESALSQEQDPLREKSLFSSLRTHPASHWTAALDKSHVFKMLLCHFSLLPSISFSSHFSAPDCLHCHYCAQLCPRAQEQDRSLPFTISLVLNLHDSTEILPRFSGFLFSSFLLFSFSQLPPSLSPNCLFQ